MSRPVRPQLGGPEWPHPRVYPRTKTARPRPCRGLASVPGL